MRIGVLSVSLSLVLVPPVHAYVEAPHSLGQCCNEATNIVLMEVSRVSKDKNLIIFKKLQDLKGKHPQNEIKHNIGQRGHHPREWQMVMKWADIGKKAVFFHNGGASETCIGTYWYQCYPEGDWWGMSHGEPFLSRTYFGNPEKLASAVSRIMQNQEVIVTCLADVNREQMHQGRGKLQRLRASLKRGNYDARRDFVAFGGDGDEVEEFRTVVVLPPSGAAWKFLPAARLSATDEVWRRADFNDGGWQQGKAPIGYGEEEIRNRRGTVVAEKGQPFLFRRFVEVPAPLLGQKGVTFRLAVASDDNAVVYLNGQLVDQDPEADHEFSYWNRDVEIPAKLFRPGPNLIAVRVKNVPNSSDLYLDMEITAQVPLPKPPPKKPVAAAGKAPPTATKGVSLDAPKTGKKPEQVLTVDKRARTVTLACTVAPRKLPNLNEVYPIEVIATYPAPRGQKAHETVVTFADVRPSDVHKALAQLGLKPGKPARGENERATGPEVRVFLEITGPDGKVARLPLEKLLADRKTGKPLPPLKWHFTGSAVKQPDPEKNDKVYGADLSGTLIALFPVTDDTVIQTNLTLKEEPLFKLETDKKVLPKEGTPARLIIEAR